MNDSEELAEKYHKLFQDYTRIKAQHAVLKKAVLKEQTENATIQAAMKEKEQEVRKSLQDLDLLSFHNQRLTKRIENLQTLATAKPGGSWLGMGGGSVKKELEKSQTTLEAATIDLQAKIEENEKLHQQLYEINALYPRHVTELQGKIQTLEKQNQELQVDVERASVANEDTINMIRKEKQDMEKELSLIRDVLAGQLKDEQHANKSLREKAERLENEIDRLSKVEVDLESLQAEHARVKDEMETFKWISSELSNLQKAYGALEQDKAQLDKAHAQLAQNYNALKQTEDALRRTLAQEQDSSRSLHEKTQHLVRDLNAIKGEASEREQSHGQRIKQLESDLAQARKEQEQLKVEYNELKVAEQSAKEGESRTKSDLARDISTVESNLSAAKATIKELETAKATLEKELTETKATLEETKARLLEKEKVSSNTAPVTTNGPVEKHEDTADESAHAEEEPAEKETTPLSKKARKKKAAAAAAAVAVAAEAASASKEDIKAEEKDSAKDLGAEQKLEKALEEQKAIEESLKGQITTLQSQIDNSRELSASTEKQLGATQSALEALKDEKLSLSSSLEMHVELTLQLQQEVDSLKTELAKRQKLVNGASSPKATKTTSDEEEPLVKTKYAQPATEAPKVEARDESTQVGPVEAADKAVQSEQTKTVDEGVQVDETKEKAPKPLLKDHSALLPLPLVGDDASTTSSNQSNREYLIKKHYEAKLQNITEQLQLSDGRYSRLHREFGMLKELLLETRKEKESADRAMEALRLKNSHLQEELAAAKEDNRAQVETMTNFMRSLEHGR
ncbi:hypothetical protein BGZ52_007920 [Haplosporangium bisporale]|nr:hypothetical protein BGZ52_007920 [Haplosporangium bisporale]KAF9201191.1 hypothetical protein BGZ59_002872 [Podila verticillata]KFH66040.1 hypothetical protein MVEG_08141 [Podila verticillata NRRL 6337]